tara:strand:- start:1492 stop:1758 length:267 start_codon:yes stop_codon:yes gene_type:complete
MNNFKAKAEKRLGKKRMEIVEFVEVEGGEDTVFAVGLKDGWVNVGYGDTVWQFNEDHLDRGDYTEKTMFDDLIFFFSDVELRPAYFEQ